ncbi:MAG: DUF3500 domain-containing protein [Planctomycetota bacterium]|jgi:predicted GNAT family acetyltransferase
MFGNVINRLAYSMVAVAAVCVSGVATAQDDQPVEPAGKMLTEAVQALVKDLAPEQKEQALLGYDDPHRTHWHYIPKFARKGLSMRDMNKKQIRLTMAVVKASSSGQGFAKANRAMALEALQHAVEDGRSIRDRYRYYLTIFGEPKTTGRWGLSFEGHHMSLNLVVTEGVITHATPNFFGANPLRVRKNGGVGPKVGTVGLAKEESAPFELLATLSDDQKKTAIISEKPPRDMGDGHQAQAVVGEAVGLAAKDMDDDQKALLKKVINAYLLNPPREFSKPFTQKMYKAGFNRVKFAWYGATKPEVGHAYIIQGPTFVIKYFNTQKGTFGEASNHAHAIIRTLDDDFAAKGQ